MCAHVCVCACVCVGVYVCACMHVLADEGLCVALGLVACARPRYSVCLSARVCPTGRVSLRALVLCVAGSRLRAGGRLSADSHGLRWVSSRGPLKP